MNQSNPTPTEPATSTPRPAFELAPTELPITVGAILRESRLQHDLSIEQAAQQLRLSSRQILALESDDYNSLPDRTYARGFLRNYARLLKLNPDEIVALSPMSVNPNSPKATIEPIEKNIGEIKMSDTSQAGDWHKWLIPALLLAVVLVGGIFYQIHQQNTRLASESKATTTPSAPIASTTEAAPKAAENTVPATPTPNTITPALPANNPNESVPSNTAATTTIAANTNAPAAPTEPVTASNPTPVVVNPNEGKLQFVFSGQSWVEVRDASNSIIYSRRHEKGEKIEVEGKAPFQMVIGNAAEVKLKYKGKDVDISDTSPAGVARLTLN